MLPMKSSDPVISVKNIHKTYGTLKAVDNLGFTVRCGVCFGLLGPNGAGKTTIMKMVYGKSQCDPRPESVISVFGLDPRTDELAIKFRSGVVPQENNLDEELNVEQNLRVFARFYALSRSQTEERIGQLLEFMELSDKRKAKIKQLSGGMKRRLIIARALLNNPKLLVLDEPTTGLDPQVRHLIWDRVRSLKKHGMSILLTTHYMEEAFQLCDSVLIMDKGRHILEGSPETLVRENIEDYVLEIVNRDAVNTIVVERDSSIRIDESGEITRLYCNDSDRLRSIADLLGPGDFHFRQSNLEDLFLRATGRQLNAQQ